MTSREPLLPEHTVAVTPVHGLATAVTVLVGTTCAASVFSTWTDWSTYWAVDDYLAERPGVTSQVLYDADQVSTTGGLLYLAALLATAVVFLVWLWRARQNAVWIHRAEHRLTRGWVTGSWFVPVINLWFPYQVVDDIHRASDPAAPYEAGSTTQLRGSRLVAGWWIAWIASNLIVAVATFALDPTMTTAEGFQQYALISTVSTALECLAGVLLIQLVRQISAWQTIPRAVPPPAPRWQ